MNFGANGGKNFTGNYKKVTKRQMPEDTYVSMRLCSTRRRSNQK